MKIMAKSVEYYYGTGRRKTASARVFITPGKGEMVVNGKPMGEYFGTAGLRIIAKQPLAAVGAEGQFDCMVTVKGSGPSGQAGAIVHGLARALVDYAEKNELPESEYRGKLRAEGHMTRDSRRVERKKPGLRGARRRRQFSKR